MQAAEQANVIVKSSQGKKQKQGMEPSSVQSIQMIDLPPQNKIG